MSILNQKIAILILTHNRFKELRYAILSALSSRGVNFDILVFDNNSNYDISSFVSKFKKPNIFLFRHNKNIGFKNNFIYAIKKILPKYKYCFLLSDDDIIAYPRAIRDLFNLLKIKKDVHIVRGGFCTYRREYNDFEQLYIYKVSDSNYNQVQFALSNNITFYSGLLFKTDLFDIKCCNLDNLVSPFLTPLLKILKTKKYKLLTSKITIISKTDGDQLATKIYSEPISNDDALKISMNKINIRKKLRFTPHIHELVNYKIYSINNKFVKKYYKLCLKYSSNKFIYKLIYYSPKSIIFLLKMLLKKIVGIKSKIIILMKHKYVILPKF